MAISSFLFPNHQIITLIAGLAGSDPALAQKVFTLGYPQTDLLGVALKYTDGTVSALSGLDDDPRFLQVSVPVQSGNSGGPLINSSGEVIGIVVSKLSAVKVFALTGDLPQNVNYAVKVAYLKPLLAALEKPDYPLLPVRKAESEELVSRIAYSRFDLLERGVTNEDPLGFFAYAARLAEEWLPGITTRTRRIRYYSMVCAGLYLIESLFKEKLRTARNRDEETTRLFMRWERIWAVWNGAVVEGQRAGMIGRNKVAALFVDGEFAGQSIDYPFIQRQSELGALGSYRTSLAALGFLLPDSLELTADGQRLAKLFWSSTETKHAWNKCGRALKSGRFEFPRQQSQLLKYAKGFGLDTSTDAEKQLIRTKLLPEGAARSLVLKLVRAHHWGQLSEEEILREAGHEVAAAIPTGRLESCARVIVALEAFRQAALGLLRTFRDRLYKKGNAADVGELSAEETAELAKKVNSTHQILMRVIKHTQHGTVFDDFPFMRCCPGQNAGAWLNDLLEIHKVEMAKRRSPRWFIPVGGGRWTLDPSLIGQTDTLSEHSTYNYRTANLISLARETGCHV